LNQDESDQKVRLELAERNGLCRIQLYQQRFDQNEQIPFQKKIVHGGGQEPDWF